MSIGAAIVAASFRAATGGGVKAGACVGSWIVSGVWRCGAGVGIGADCTGADCTGVECTGTECTGANVGTAGGLAAGTRADDGGLTGGVGIAIGVSSIAGSGS